MLQAVGPLNVSALTQTPIQVPFLGFIGNLVLAALLGLVLRDVYIRHGQAVGNRRALAANFILLITTTMFIISVVKSSLALSLGLVGALSIVRFRTAIKEPEELAYLFLCIAIGLGLGADQTFITLIAFMFIIILILLHSVLKARETDTHMFMIIGGTETSTSLEQITNILKDHARTVHLKRHDEQADRFEATFIVEFTDFAHLQAAQTALKGLSPRLTFTFFDNRP